MKTRIALSIILLVIAGCSDDSASSPDTNSYTGIWVPYEINYSDGTSYTGPFRAMSIFGVYAESLHLKDDNTYVPIIWTSGDDYDIKEDDKGKYSINGSTIALSEGSWDMIFTITKYSDEELWLTYTEDIPLLGGTNTQYKLKRKIK